MVRIDSIIIFHLSELWKPSSLCCNISGEAAGEIGNWSLLGMKGPKCLESDTLVAMHAVCRHFSISTTIYTILVVKTNILLCKVNKLVGEPSGLSEAVYMSNFNYSNSNVVDITVIALRPSNRCHLRHTSEGPREGQVNSRSFKRLFTPLFTDNETRNQQRIQLFCGNSSLLEGLQIFWGLRKFDLSSNTASWGN